MNKQDVDSCLAKLSKNGFHPWNAVPVGLVDLIAEDLVDRPNKDQWLFTTEGGNVVVAIKITHENESKRIEFYLEYPN